MIVERAQVADIYPLVPAQRGILAKSLDGGEPGVYVTQFSCRVDGPLDADCFEAAWERLVLRHPALRSAFVWDELDEPLQVVHRHVPVPFSRQDWRGSTASEQAERLDAYLAADRRRAFALSRAPLMRVALAREDVERWRLIWTHHHLILDGWSASLVLQELLRIYGALREGAPATLPPAAPYRAFVEWLDTQDRVETERFWQGALADVEGPTQIGSSTRRPVDGVSAYGEAELVLRPDETAALTEAARRNGLTLSVLLQGAWAILLSRWSGRRDVLFGAVASVRPATLDGADSIAGVMVHTLPVRARVRRGADAMSWLRALQEEQAAAREHAFAPAAVTSFETVVTLENYPTAIWRGNDGDLDVTDVRVLEQPHYPLTIQCIPRPELMVRAIFARERFEEAAVRRLLRQLRGLLDRLAAEPAPSLDDLRLEPDASPVAVAPTVRSPGRSLHGWFEDQAARTPTARAVTSGAETLTYGELDRRANRLANHLRRLGVGPEVCVGLFLDRSLETVVAILAVLKAGGAYLPLEPSEPDDRVAFVLEDSQAPLTITTLAQAGRPALAGRRLVCVDGDAAAIARESGDGPSHAASPASLAYVIYTSGSTGRPKGVLVSHENVTRLMEQTEPLFGFGPDDTGTLFHSYAFDFSVWELWGALLYGGRLVVVPEAVSRSPGEFARLLRLEGVTVLSQTPSAFRALVDADAAEPERAHTLRLVVFGGERLDLSILRLWLRRYPDTETELVNMYGVTETTVHVTHRRVRADDVAAELGSVIGAPVPGMRAYVVDDDLRQVPEDVPGELLVAGSGVARGYLGRAALTAERFVPDPFATEPGARAYRSGDRVRRLSERELEYLGRADEQVKVRGHRVEPGEVEAALRRHESVADTVVTTWEPAVGPRQLVAHVVLRPPPPSVRALRRHLEALLPAYMVPSRFVILDALPVTRNGKVDRRALPPPDRAAAQGGPSAPPRTPLEQTLAGIWAKTLGVDRLGIYDSFFELGGDSILSIEAVSRARRAGLDVTQRQMFECRTIATLAAALETDRPAIGAREQAPPGGVVPVTPIQRWFLDLELQAPSHWNQTVRLAVRGAVDPSRLDAAIRRVVARHDALRLRFEHGAEGWEQRLGPAGQAGHFVHVDLAAVDPERQAEAIETQVATLETSLDLGAGPLFRAAYLDLGPNRHGVLVVTAHHLVVDAVSWRVLLHDLVAVYAEGSTGPDLELPAPGTPFADYARRLEDYAKSPGAALELPFWEASAAGRSAASVPRDFAASEDANTEDTARVVTVALDAAETETLLRQVRRGYNAQALDALLAGLAVVLAEWTRRPRLAIALEGHGRDMPFDGVDVSGTVGWFTALFPIVLDLAGVSEASAALAVVKEELRRIPNQGVGFGVLRHLGPPEARDALSASAWPSVSLNYLGTSPAGELPLDWELLGVQPSRAPSARRPHLIDVEASVDAGALSVRWIYSAALHRPETVAKLANGHLEALRAIARGCAARPGLGHTPSDFPLAALDQEELDELDRRWPIDDVYPLTPLQQGMLFHALYDPESTVHFAQFSWALRGPLDAAAFESAWQRVVERHPVLRTAFVSEGVAQPLQVVLRDRALPWEVHDWRELPHAERTRRLADHLEADRRRPFDLASPPLMRMSLIRLEDELHHCVWSFHHLVLDGWSTGVVLRDAFLLYELILRGVPDELPPARSYRDFVAWLLAQDGAAAERFWRHGLGDSARQPRLDLGVPPGIERPPDGDGYAICERALDSSATARLQRLTRGHDLTLGTLVLGAWATVLSHIGRQRDVVFGCTVAGRALDLVGVEQMVGLFINTLPVRILVEPEQPLIEWLREIQRVQVEMREYEHTSLAQIARWTRREPREALFDTVVVLENLPGVDSDYGGGLSVEDAGSYVRNSFPLTVRAVPGASLRLDVMYDEARFDEASAQRIFMYLEALLSRMGRNPAATVAELARALDEVDARLVGIDPRQRADGARQRLALRRGRVPLSQGQEGEAES